MQDSRVCPCLSPASDSEALPGGCKVSRALSQLLGPTRQTVGAEAKGQDRCLRYETHSCRYLPSYLSAKAEWAFVPWNSSQNPWHMRTVDPGYGIKCPRMNNCCPSLSQVTGASISGDRRQVNSQDRAGWNLGPMTWGLHLTLSWIP